MTEAYPVPFAPRRSDNMDRLTSDEVPCYVCGKACSSPRYWGHFGLGGGHIVSDVVAETDPTGDLGSYPIGPECYRKLPAWVRKTLVKEASR